MNTAVTTREDSGIFSLTPTTLKEAMDLAKLVADSDLAPPQYKGKPGNVLIAVQMGAEIGLTPMAAIQTIAVINNRPSLYGDAGKAILLSHGCIIEEHSADQVRASGMGRCKITRPGRPPVERTFSRDDAKQAGLLNKDGPWKLYPERMLAWRAFWFAARDAAADLLKGLHGAEEVRDVPPERDMGAADVVEVARPVDKTAAITDALAGKSAAPTLDEVLKDIKAATTAEALTKAAAKCAQLVNVDDKATARGVYKERFAKLKAEADAAAAQAPAETTGGPTYAEVADMISKADSVAAVNAALDLARSFKDDGQREELIELGAKKADELTPV